MRELGSANNNQKQIFLEKAKRNPNIYINITLLENISLAASDGITVRLTKQYTLPKMKE